VPHAPLSFGPYRLDPRRKELWSGEGQVELSPLILRLLVYLACNRNRTVPIVELRAEVWRGVHVSEAALHQAVRQARRAVGDDGRCQAVIRTFPRVGYRFVADAVEEATPPGHVGRYVGRADLLDELAEIVGEAAAGRAGFAVVSGEAGIGKTRTLAEVDRMAREAGLLVVHGAGSPHGGAPPFWPWVQALRELVAGRPVRALRDKVEGLAARLGDPEDAAGAGRVDPLGVAPRFQLFDEVAQGLRRASALGPIAILLDDLHDAGSAVLELFEFLAREVERDYSLLLAAAYRPVEALRSARRAAVVARLDALSMVRSFSLEGLRDEESHELIALHEERLVEPRVLRVLVDRARGNPFYLVELTRELGRSGDWGETRVGLDPAEHVARSLHRVMLSRLATLTDPVRKWLHTAAALGLRFEQALVDELHPDVDPEEARSDALRRGFLVESVSRDGDLAFVHALIRDAVYADIPQGRRRKIHLRIARAIEAQHLVEAAFHYAEAAPLGGLERTVSMLRYAADVSQAQFDGETAGSLLRKAVHLVEAHDPDGQDTLCDLLIAYGRVSSSEGRIEEAREALEAATRLARSHGWGSRLALATLAIGQEVHYDALADEDLIKRLEEALERIDDDALRARLLSRLAMEIRYRPDGHATSERALDEALEHARRSGDVATRARVLEDATLVRWSAADPARWLDLSHELVRTAREAGDADLLFRGVVGLVTERMQLADRNALHREIARCFDLAERYPAPHQRASRTLIETARDLLAGDFESAGRGVARSLAAEMPEVLLPAMTQLYYLHLETGRLPDLEPQLLEHCEREPRRDSWKLALSRLYVEEQQLDEARVLLDRTTPAADMPRDRLWLPTVALMAEIVAALGDRRAAKGLVDLLEPFAGLSAVYGRGTLYYGSVSHFVGMLARVTGDLDRAETYLRDAIGVHERMASPPWEVKSRVELLALQIEREGVQANRSDIPALRHRAARMTMAPIVRRIDALSPPTANV